MSDNIKVGQGVDIRPTAVLEAIDNGTIEIGDRVFISYGVIISSMASVKIGKNTRIGEYSSIRDHDHNYMRSDIPFEDQGFTVKPTVIGEDVWIAARCTIGEGVTIGKGAVIGAHTVIKHDVPPYAVVVSQPAPRILKYRGVIAK